MTPQSTSFNCNANRSDVCLWRHYRYAKDFAGLVSANDHKRVWGFNVVGAFHFKLGLVVPNRATCGEQTRTTYVCKLWNRDPPTTACPSCRPLPSCLFRDAWSILGRMWRSALTWKCCSRSSKRNGCSVATGIPRLRAKASRNVTNASMVKEHNSCRRWKAQLMLFLPTH